jgi:hypothetical protein
MGGSRVGGRLLSNLLYLAPVQVKAVMRAISWETVVAHRQASRDRPAHRNSAD